MSREWSDVFADEDCRAASQPQREFLTTLLQRTRRWDALGVGPADVDAFADGDEQPRILAFVSIDVTSPRQVLRTLRVELREGRVWVGDDLTYQGHPLDPAKQPVVEMEGDAIAVLTHRAADWVDRELQRPIEEHVWIADGFTHKKNILADTNTVLTWSDSQNQRRDPKEPATTIRLLRGTRAPQK